LIRVSKHWNPDEELAHRIAAEELARAAKKPLPEGSVTGLLLVAASCLALGALLHQVAGPRHLVEENVAGR
jgi:hypothetical protein